MLARRGPRGYRHIVVDRRRHRRAAAGVLGADAPGGIASEDGRFGPDGRSVYVRASLPGAPVRRPRRSRRRSRCPRTACPGEGRVVLSRPDADLDGYALRTDGTVLAVWNVDGVTELRVHAAVRRRAASGEIALPEPVMPGWSLAADGATMVAELTGPRTPRGLWRVPLTGCGPRRRRCRRRRAVPTRPCW